MTGDSLNLNLKENLVIGVKDFIAEKQPLSAKDLLRVINGVRVKELPKDVVRVRSTVFKSV